MPERRLLYLDATGLSAWRWSSGRLAPLARFPAAERGHAAFVAWLAEQPPSTRMSLLTDLVEEGFELESLPRTHGADRAAMIRRKLAQHFFGSALTTHLGLGREHDGRGDERVLMCGLTRPALLEPWLAALARAQTPLTGIHTVALLADRLVRRWPGRPDRFLLVNFSPAGVRQTFFDHGRLRFSRLAAASHASVASLATLCREELRRTYAYLVGQRMIARGERLQVRLLAHPGDFPRPAELAAAGADLDVQLADLDAAGDRAGLATPMAHSDALPLFLHKMAHALNEPQCAPPELRRFHRLWRARLAVIGGGAAVLAACLALAAREWVDTRDLARDTASLEARAADQMRRHDALLATLPPLPATLERLRTLFAELDGLPRASAPALPAFRRIGRALDAEPAIELDRLSWRQGAAARDRDLFAGEDPAAFTVAELRARLPGALAADQRALVERSEGFVARLREAADTRVRVLRMPLELDSDRSVRGGGLAASADAPEIELRIAFPSGAPL